MDTLLAGLIQERFERLNEVQKRAWPVVASGANVLVIAPTGFGKTEAALLPLFDSLLSAGGKAEERKGIRILYITPLKALNRDMLERIEWWCKKLGLTVAVRHGDTKGAERARQANEPPHLMITTPETLAAMLVGKKLGEALANVGTVVVDEVHELFGDKRGAQLALSLERLVWRKKGEVQRVGLSATVADAETVARFLGGDRLCEVVKVDRDREMKIIVKKPAASEDAELAAKLHVDAEALGRLLFLKEIASKGKTLVFVNTRSMAEMLVSRLLKIGCKVAAHHGSLSREARLSAEEEFKHGKIDALICTSSLELGIDIGDIDRVVQYSSPRQAARLVQRVGRSGHAEHLVPNGTVIATDIHDALECEVIAERALKGSLEGEKMVRPALDVLAHALAGIAVERGPGPFSAQEACACIRRAAPYAGMREEVVRAVAEQLVKERLLREEKGRFAASGRTLLYYYKNVSTIPRSKKVRVRNAATNAIISSLDEEFVASLEQGQVFLSKGTPWAVLDVGEEVVVEPSEDLAAALPEWSGEQIPIHYEVARELCKQRHALGREGKGEGAQLFASIPAGDNRVVIEKCEEVCLIHLCAGTKANRTLGLALSALFSARFGVGVRADADAYSIILRLPHRVSASEVAAVLASIRDARGIVRAKMSESHLFKYRLTHVARLFGLIGEDMVIGTRAAGLLEGTPIYAETAESALFDYCDFDAAEEILKRIGEGKIDLIAQDVGRLSALGSFLTVRLRAGEFIAPIEPTAEVLKAFSAQIASKTVRFLCTYCGRVSYEKIEDMKGKLHCKSCGSPMLAVIGRQEEPKELLLPKNRAELLLRASLVEAYGRRAALCLSTYGVGSRTAARILARLHKDEGHLFVDLLEAQKNFIRTKRYWQAR
ncbi:ATP-dependent DNA helicase Hel308 [Candidatus Burarchaeum australiense]|nr:ATP-dependent DNA helicase Hel308 [Candidatus Burarchaeum australiense]